MIKKIIFSLFFCSFFYSVQVGATSASEFYTTPLQQDIQFVIDFANTNYPGWNGIDRAYVITTVSSEIDGPRSVALLSVPFESPTVRNWNGHILDRVFSIEYLWGNINYLTFNNTGLSDLTKNIYITKDAGYEPIDSTPYTDYSYMTVSGDERYKLYTWQNVYTLNAYEPELIPDFSPEVLSAGPLVNYVILPKQINLKVNIPDENQTYIKYVISYGGYSPGDPQFETWSIIKPVDDNIFNFEYPYIAQVNQTNIYGAYTIYASYCDELGVLTSLTTNTNIVIRQNMLNMYSGTFQGDDYPELTAKQIPKNILQNCGISSSFPFIETAGCSESLTNLVTVLSFDRINFNKGLTQDVRTCKQINTLSTWLNLGQNFEVCPKFSSEIRNDVSAFLTFILGITALGFFIRSKRVDR